MNRRIWTILAGLCGLAMLMQSAVPAGAQEQEVKSKPAMLTYVASWQIPRADWGDVQKELAVMDPIMNKAVADGTLVGYGHSKNLVHQPDAMTHDNWWSAMSMAGVVKPLDQLLGAVASSGPVLSSATAHWDNIYVSHYYNWKSGSFKGGYLKVAQYKFKESAPDDALDTIAQHLVVPILEKQLADGTIVAYQIGTMAIHTAAPGTFFVVYVSPTPEGLDTVQKAILDSSKAHPLGFEAFDGMTDDSGHRDQLEEGDGTFK